MGYPQYQVGAFAESVAGLLECDGRLEGTDT